MAQETGSAKLHLVKSLLMRKWMARYDHLPMLDRPAPLVPCINNRGKEVQEYVTQMAAVFFYHAGERGFTEDQLYRRASIPNFSIAMRREAVRQLEAAGKIELKKMGAKPQGGRPRTAWVWIGGEP